MPIERKVFTSQVKEYNDQDLTIDHLVCQLYSSRMASTLT